MYTELSEHGKYIVVAGSANDLARYVVKGDKIKEIYNTFERVVFIGKLECFETYTKNPETGEGGWDIEYVEGVKEKIEKYYPNFDCFITQGYPSDLVKTVKFHSIEREDYPLREL